MDEPVYIAELGAGHGRFAALFVRSLLRQLEESPLYWAGSDSTPRQKLRFVYVMTDFSEAMVDGWSSSPELKQFASAGLLAFSTFDADSSASFRLRWACPSAKQSASVLSTDSPTANPLLLVASYFFDSLVTDCFRVQQGRLQVGRVTSYLMPEGTRVQPNVPTRHAAMEAATAASAAAGEEAACVDDEGGAPVHGVAAGLQRRIHREWSYAPVASQSCYDNPDFNGT